MVSVWVPRVRRPLSNKSLDLGALLSSDGESSWTSTTG